MDYWTIVATMTDNGSTFVRVFKINQPVTVKWDGGRSGRKLFFEAVKRIAEIPMSELNTPSCAPSWELSASKTKRTSSCMSTATLWSLWLQPWTFYKVTVIMGLYYPHLKFWCRRPWLWKMPSRRWLQEFQMIVQVFSIFKLVKMSCTRFMNIEQNINYRKRRLKERQISVSNLKLN